MKNLPPFYQFQKVVALEGGKWIKKGQEYTVQRLFQFSCGCWAIDVGIDRKRGGLVGCTTHNSNVVDEDVWFHSKFFAPIQEKFESISFEKVIEKESELIGAN